MDRRMLLKTAAALIATPGAMLHSTAAAMAKGTPEELPVERMPSTDVDMLRWAYRNFLDAHDAAWRRGDASLELDYDPLFVDVDYWEAVFWSIPCRSLDAVQEKAQYITNDRKLFDSFSSGYVMSPRYKCAPVHIECREMFLSNVNGEGFDIELDLLEKMRAENAVWLHEEMRRREEREKVPPELEFKTYSDIPDDLCPEEIKKLLEDEQDQIQALIELNRRINQIAAPVLAKLNGTTA